MNDSGNPGDKRDWAVVVSSFDDSCDLWPLFFHFFFQCWPDAPTPVYLVTNFRTYDDPRVVSLCVGKDASWGDTITHCLDQVQARYVWLLLDDLFLDAPVETARINDVVAWLKQNRGKYFETARQSQIGEKIEGTDFRRIPPENPQAGINSAIYEVDFLRSLTQPGFSIWDGNMVLNKLNLAGCPDLYYLNEGVPPLISFLEAVKGKFWKPEAMAFLQAAAVKPDLRWRPFPPQGRGPVGKSIRSIYKRLMEWRKRRDERRFAAGTVPAPVRPLAPPNQ